MRRRRSRCLDHRECPKSKRRDFLRVGQQSESGTFLRWRADQAAFARGQNSCSWQEQRGKSWFWSTADRRKRAFALSPFVQQIGFFPMACYAFEPKKKTVKSDSRLGPWAVLRVRVCYGFNVTVATDRRGKSSRTVAPSILTGCGLGTTRSGASKLLQAFQSAS